MLAQMIKPRGDDEILHVNQLLAGVLKNIPVTGPIPPAGLAPLLHQGQELLFVAELQMIVNAYHHWPLLRRYRNERLGFLPVTGRAMIQLATAFNWPASTVERAEDNTDGGDQHGSGNRAELGDTAPDERAQCQGAHEEGQEYR